MMVITRLKSKLAAFFIAIASVCTALAQNVVDDAPADIRLERTEIERVDALALVNERPAQPAAPTDATAKRVRKKLETHLEEFLTGPDLLPFHNTLGISNHETYFDHPDETFYALSIACPLVRSELKQRIKQRLANELPEWPPYALDGYDRTRGRPRESYTLPEGLRAKGRGKAGDTFGVYAFWCYCHFVDPAAVTNHYAAVKQRIEPLLATPYLFVPDKLDYRNDEAERLNGDLAGLVGFARLAKLQKDNAVYERTIDRLRDVLDLRVNLERVNPRIVEPTQSTTAHLHVHKLARYCRLTPEIAASLLRHDAGAAKQRLHACREMRNGWYLAFGDRVIGGENYTNPPHFARALFAGAALIEELPADELASYIDVPWCKGDMYFIEKCVLALLATRTR
jgi:hypothetical protein